MSRQRTRQKQAERGATKPSEVDVKGKLVEYIWYMKKQGYREASIVSYTKRIEALLSKGAILSDPAQVKKTIAGMETWNAGSKQCMADAYDIYVKMSGLIWDKPHYNPRESLPFIPTEKEIDQLTMGCGLKVRCFLQGLKETGAGGGELHAIEWKDIDFERKKLMINHPTKGHNARILDVSDEWLRMISRMPRTAERVWTCQYGSQSANFHYQRRRLAHEYNNPRLSQISFRTLRHWKGTMEYHRTHDLKHVQRVLGHKTSQSTDIYVHIEEQLFENLPKEYIVRRAVSVKGCMRLAAMGYEKFDDVNGIHLYRKPRIV